MYASKVDYADLLYKAQENNRNASNKEVRCYKTTFAPPKKLEKSSVSSENIKKFLARKEEEERKRREEAQKKKEELLALRSQDKKAQRRVQVMLKSTKSANKSVMADAVDNVNTRDTLNGFQQCDEDDYGYVSQEASAFYNKLLSKYENMPPEPSKFKPAKKEVKDLNAAKDRVKAALQKEAEDELLPHKRKRKKNEENENSESEPKKEIIEDNDTKKTDEKVISKPKKKFNCPPPLKFDQLLEIAKTKQFEPIMVDESKLIKEPERLLTKKQKLEQLKEQEARNNKTKLQNPKTNTPITSKNNSKMSEEQADITSSVPSKKKKLSKPEISDKIQKEESKTSTKQENMPNKVVDSKILQKRLEKPANVWKSSNQVKPSLVPSEDKKMNIIKSAKSTNCPKPKEKSSDRKVKPSDSGRSSDVEKMSVLELKLKEMQMKQEILQNKLKLQKLELKKMTEKKNSEPKKIVKKPVQEKKKPVAKRRIDSESEYDSELDDFIDDGPEDENDYSKYISQIFGYDKSKYANVEEDEDECMESNFHEIAKEEFVSAKIGLMEDLEDIRKEQEEKKRLKQKKMKKLMEERKKKK